MSAKCLKVLVVSREGNKSQLSVHRDKQTLCSCHSEPPSCPELSTNTFKLPPARKCSYAAASRWSQPRAINHGRAQGKVKRGGSSTIQMSVRFHSLLANLGMLVLQNGTAAVLFLKKNVLSIPLRDCTLFFGDLSLM